MSLIPCVLSQSNESTFETSISTEAEMLILHQVISGGILLLGAVGYVEAAFVADARRRSALSAVAFLQGAARERCAL